MPNPIVLEILENERDMITKAINILKYGGSGQKRRGRPPKAVSLATPGTESNGHAPKQRKLTAAGKRRRLAGYRQWQKKQHTAAAKP